MYNQYWDKELPVQISPQSIATNTFLFKVGISDTALCYLCKSDKETLIHLFWECLVMKTFWERVHGFFVSIHLIPASHVLDIYECLGFKGEKDDVLVSHCLLLARYSPVPELSFLPAPYGG